MIEITIHIADKVKKMLDRYYPHTNTLEERFYQALDDGTLVKRGKSFYLSAKMDEVFSKIHTEERDE